MNILIADDHSLILEGFVSVLQKQDSSLNCFMATNKFELLDILRNESIDVLFQDVLFGKEDARDFISDLIKEFPDLKIIILTSLGDKQTVETLLKQGVNGYLIKADATKELFNAIHTVLSGKIYLGAGVHLATHNIPPLTNRKVILTLREKEVLSLILKEKTTREIAAELCISQKTVENHRANLLIKFGSKNLAGLVKQAILEGFL